MHISVIIPIGRPGEARRVVESILGQNCEDFFEIILVSPNPLDLPSDGRIRLLHAEENNPATRRNRAALVARGDVLAFTDDDAVASPDWMRTGCDFLRDNRDVVALGGPDPAPPDSTSAQLISDTLLATPMIGSGIACHENRAGIFDLRAAHDLALVNLFVRRSDFDAVGGFDESIGYIGEDTALIEKLMQRGRVVYHSGCVVFHRRRAFPLEYLRQRWHYRLKTGELLIRGGRRYRSGKLFLFLAAGVGFIAAAVLSKLAAFFLLGVYAGVTLTLGVRATRLSPRWWPLLPFAFFAHHATYFAGILAGAARALVSGRALHVRPS
jgi:mycofactocin glycosyltransferase